MLKSIGYGVEVAANGLEALECLARDHYAAVLMDCQMPVMDGYQATEELREREGTRRHTPVIALTASAVASDRDLCLGAGMDDYLTKPFGVRDLDAALTYCLDLAASGGSWDRGAASMSRRRSAARPRWPWWRRGPRRRPGR
jgi:two-component system sensor histidine kinase/response regulator